jgi:integrase
MTVSIREMVKLAAIGKTPDDFLFTRSDGSPVKDFRKSWRSLCIKAGLGRMVWPRLPKDGHREACGCGGQKFKYVGLIRHDLRRSAARELRRAGVGESTIMAIGGWRTASMFRRYAITDPRDIKAAIEKREEKQEQDRAEARANSQQERQAEAEGTADAATDAVQ